MVATAAPIASLRDYNFISLTTFRKNGQAVPTPVTFGEANGKLYVVTGLKTGKIKRLQHTPAVEVAACDRQGTIVGTSLKGHARMLSPEEGKALRSRLKFRAPAPIMVVYNLLRTLRSGGNVYLEISLG